MAKTGSSSRFVSMNLSKSYGSSAGHGRGISSGPSSSSGGRGGSQRGRGGMVILSRSGRSQASASSVSSRPTSKLVIPRPVNLPSLRREHAGNEPAVPPLGTSGSAGWSKQQAMPVEILASSSQTGQNDSDTAGSRDIISESSRSFHGTKPAAIPYAEDGKMEQRWPVSQSGFPSSQASPARPRMYIPPSSRISDFVDSHPVQHSSPGEKAATMRAEDFPTLQAAARPFGVPPALKRHRDMQQKQHDKKQELRYQHVKLQELSQQQNMKVDVLHQSVHRPDPLLQPARPQQALPKWASTAEGPRNNARRVPEKVSNLVNGPLSMIRVTCTSNWDDDERETLHGVKVSMQSDCVEICLARNGYNGAMNRKVETETGRPVSRSGSAFLDGKERRDLRDYKTNHGFITEPQSMRDLSLSSSVVKGLSNQQSELRPWEDKRTWSRAPRNVPPKHEWSNSMKEVVSDRVERSGKSNRLSYGKKLGGQVGEMQSSASGNINIPHRRDGADDSTRVAHSQEGSNMLNVVFSNHRSDDWQGGRSRKNLSGYKYGRPDLSSSAHLPAGASSDAIGLDHRRERQVYTSYHQEPFTDKSKTFRPSQSIAFESLVGFSGFEPKLNRRKKDELLSFHDPARDLFEAELEKVQKMQEQERQRLAEEREKAIELARKIAEERERAAREEELLQLKLEEKAREATAQAHRDQEEAARKAEEIRQAREEQKRMIMLEEERRKEAARRKLLELEQRIAMRECGRIPNAGRLEKGKLQDMVMFDEYQGIQRLNVLDKNGDHVSNKMTVPVKNSAKKDLNGFLPNFSPIKSVSQISELRGVESFSEDRNKVAQLKRVETLDDRPAQLSSIMNYSHRDNFARRHDNRSLSLQEMSATTTRRFPFRESQSSPAPRRQQRVPLDSFPRKERIQSVPGDQMLMPSSSDDNKGFIDVGIERESHYRWGMDQKVQKAQRQKSPPLFSLTNGEESDYQSFSRVRQSLPKQPKVPLPIFGRSNLQKQTTQSKAKHVVSAHHNKDDPPNASKDELHHNSQELSLQRSTDRDDKDHTTIIEALSVGLPDFAPSNEARNGQLHHKSNLFHETATCSENVLQDCEDAIIESDEIDQFSEQLSELTESEAQSKDDEQQGTDSMEANEGSRLADGEDDGWAVKKSTGDMGKELGSEEEPAVWLAVDEQEWDNPKVHEHSNSLLECRTKEERDDAPWESKQLDGEGNADVDELQERTDSQWGKDQSPMSMLGNQDKKHDSKEVEIVGPQEDAKSSPIELPKTQNMSNYVQAGPFESQSPVQSFIQQFQQPFSFMAVPLPQSTTMNGVQLHPPMLPSMHNLSTQQDISYPLPMGVFPSSSLIPNAIQIGSIQMPLQMQPQMPSLAHHHQQPPVFQFGQICQFSQPVPPVQSAFQMHHVLGQPLLSQHQENEIWSSKEASKLSTVNGPAKESENFLARPSSGSNVSVDGSANSLLDGSRSPKDPMNQSSGTGLVSSSHTIVPLLESSQSKPSTHQETSGRFIAGGMNWRNDIQTYAAYGKGGERTNASCTATQVLADSFAQADASESRFFSQCFSATKAQVSEVGLNVRESQSGFKVNDAFQVQVGSVSESPIMEFDELGHKSPQCSVDYGFEEQASECHNAKADFTEVHSKRQLLREQCEMGDKAMTDNLKVEVQIMSQRKQVIGKSVVQGESSLLSAAKYTLGSQSEPNIDLVQNDGRHGKHPKSSIGSKLLQSSATLKSKCLASTPTTGLNNLRSMQCHSVAAATDPNIEGFELGYSSNNTNGAWGVQNVPHEVVDFTKTQLEEAIRPDGGDCPISQMAPILDRCATSSEANVVLPSSSLSNVSSLANTSVSVPSPVNSFLAGERIQFVTSSLTRPSSPFFGTIGSQFGLDKANCLTHPSSLATNYAVQDSAESILSSKTPTGGEEDMNGQLVDAEAEAMAAASAVAVAAISNDEASNSFDVANEAPNAKEFIEKFVSFPKASEYDGTVSRTIQAASKSLVVDNTIVAALPSDLSVEATAAPSQIPLANHSAPSEILLQNATIGSSFSGLEMGTLMGGQVFAYGLCENAAVPSFEHRVVGLGAGNMGGWQHRLSNNSDSYYGTPPPFIGPGGLPSIQGHPHMLVYTSPFTQVGQFGQLGMSFLGATCHPSGKEPDWTHIPTTTSQTSLSQRGVDINPGKTLVSDVQHPPLSSYYPQAISAAGCSVMPVPVPMSAFDPNFGSSFQAQWTRAPFPVYQDYYGAGPAPGHDLQHRLGELGFSAQSGHESTNLQGILETNISQVSNDAAADASTVANGVRVPEEHGFGYSSFSTRSLGNDGERLFNKSDSL